MDLTIIMNFQVLTLCILYTIPHTSKSIEITHHDFTALSICLFPGGPSTFVTVNPTESIARLA